MSTSETHARAAVAADRLHSLSIHLLRRLRREAAGTGLTAPQLSALSVIVYGSPISLGELAAAERVRPPTMSRLVRHLEAAGLVSRGRDPRDRRILELRATERGARVLQEGRARRVSVLADDLERLPAAELAVTESAIQVLSRILELEAVETSEEDA